MENIYFGQLDPNWRDDARSALDEQRDLMIKQEKIARDKSLPKQIAIYGGGALIILTVLIIYKYKK